MTIPDRSDAEVLEERLVPFGLRAIRIEEDWHRGGAETYVLFFSADVGGDRRAFVWKACVKMASGEVLKDWVGRRNRVSAAGLATPALIASFPDATLVEERLPLSWQEAWAQADASTRGKLEHARDEYISSLRAEGFRPSLADSDFFSHGDDAVLIDFGEDLGGFVAASRPVSEDGVGRG